MPSTDSFLATVSAKGKGCIGTGGKSLWNGSRIWIGWGVTVKLIAGATSIADVVFEALKKSFSNFQRKK